MKKTLIITALIITLFFSSVAIVNATNQIRLYVNGREIYPDVPPQIINGRTMIPIRFAAYALGAKMQWHPDKRVVVFNYKMTDGRFVVVSLGIGNNIAVKLTGHPSSDKPTEEFITMDTIPLMMKERTMVHIRFVSEALNCQVDWKEGNVYIKSSPAIVSQPIQNSPQNTSGLTVDVGIDTGTENTASVQVNVIDKTTGDPIENAIVYLGATGASEKCYSTREGKCSIEDFACGDCALGGFKKGYNRYIESSHFDKGDNFVTIKLEKKSEIPTSFIAVGTVIKTITAEGTRSENQYYKIKTDDANEEYLFDEIGMNQGFEKFVNKKVTITGFKETGFIGWEHEQVEGIYVESIE